MSAPNATLFIGGPWDGRMVYELSGHNMEVIERIRSRVDFTSMDLAPQPPEHRRVIYLRVSVIGCQFMVEEDAFRRSHMAPHEFVLDALRAGYRRPSEMSDRG